MVDILEHFQAPVYYHLQLFGVDLSITKAVVSMWVVVAAVFSFFWLATRRLSTIPGRAQSVAEVSIELLQGQLAGILGDETKKWLPFLLTLFLFILGCNLSGLIPDWFSASSNINFTATLALMVIMVATGAGIAKHGFLGYCKSIVPSGLPLAILPLLIPIEIINQLARPFSLAVRLFANVFAGHTVLLAFISMILIFKNVYVAPLPVAGHVIVSILELLFAFIQAFIFMFLSAVYVAEATSSGH
ncbi:ATP synthase F0 subunit A [candidate division WOR-1 bacterium RIFOXYA12_FULL_52_29]|uniref:ATP synthase subunit a n=1 Tax=candidate division WOR-1 bacterium RIFOXYC12_FULL_54_18 TaxID=1802584 RepID=A0A1F4T7K1_UNCSA|nr:MAG: ATP synthase F0 subunit A [candidate division WOR-1 bacterium RIFOXYA2_FULL_51_19]OGC18103.1 MAG: ATP synthase F0 subunit A [candidate division WOR-1 bacterium RIFOXYA12_FULL_52_29]OGC26959.1 MAG: ATP synthase F0 subunit A [candidate division WOR-1 bacterium RIFOXYB2_FULL_45_9]OGC28520.1 MAG: ATP synthase F0 subunit A [candidate division WOR-1 bacterium RIFOXYC12_FULL_54_18]OGC31025.1 MAG: ATP synthase F0 subunit A [candidate division WOR-1 bacterium RIFOXYB12_FULL_52_16]